MITLKVTNGTMNERWHTKQGRLIEYNATNQQCGGSKGPTLVVDPRGGAKR